jgi:tetratricopeptide (TPR) repeat protein
MLREMLILIAIGFQPGGGIELLGSPNRAEALRLADEILAMGDKAPFDARAQALAIKGRWTEGLIVFAEGLRGHLRGDLADGLLLLIRNHPCLKRDDVDRVNLVEAERLYAQGVRLYFQCDYRQAEKLFLMSLENFDQDARTFYFLGLSRLGQGNMEQAYASFEMGAQLERGGRPGKDAINAALERVQGPERRLLGQIRDRVEK